MIYAVFYKGNTSKKGVKGLYERLEDAVIRCATKGPYSHCELAIKDKEGYYTLFSSSPRDKGVRSKTARLDLNKWDIIEIDVPQNNIINYFNQTRGARYDILGVLGIVLPVKDKRSKFFCSEWCYNAIFNSTEGHRIDPNRLYALLKDVYGNKKH